MKRTTLSLTLFLAVGSAPALAAEHLMHVSEVQISNNNDANIRFVELADPGLEPFPNTYRLRIYDAAGNTVETVSLTVPANTQRMLIATQQVSANRDGTLTMPLPVDGTACFENATSNTKIHCLAWGCVTNPFAGSSRSASPPTGQSAQRQADGTYHIGTPTPDAANQAGTTAAACPTAPDAGVVDGPINTGPDAGMNPMPDAGNNNNNNGDDGGCCQVDGSRGATGAVLLAFVVGLVLRRRRR